MTIIAWAKVKRCSKLTDESRPFNAKESAWLVPGLKIVLGLSLLALLSACDKEKPVEKDRPRVFVQEVKLADYAVNITLTGDVQARVQTELSFRVGGKIIQRTVDVGDRVSARQVLARLDPKDLQTNVDSAQAQVVAEQAKVKQNAAAFVRQKLLYIAAAGVAGLVVSDELDELFEISDRLHVMFRGSLAPADSTRATTRDAVGLAMAGSFEALGQLAEARQAARP